MIILFDLDGTLLDTSVGIFNSVRYTEKQMNLTPITDILLKKFVGPPPRLMYQEIYGLSVDNAIVATMYHRQYGETKAIYEATPYAGIEDVLDSLQRKNIRLGVATLKKQIIAEKVLKNVGLYDYFDVIVGMNEEESFTKQDTIRIAKNQVKESEAILIGDTTYDLDGAINAGISFIGVTYGFGFIPNEIYSFATANTPQEILELIEA